MDLLSFSMLPTSEPKPTRVHRSEGFMLCLMQKLDTKTHLLQLEDNSDEMLNLDDSLIWKQKKVKEKVVQFYEILLGEKIEAKVIRLCFKQLSMAGFTGTRILRNLLIESGYSEKTAQAQSSQMINLFKNLKIVVPNLSDQMPVNQHSLLFKRYCETMR